MLSLRIPIFTKKMLDDQPIDVFGGTQTRDFIYALDVAKANLTALQCDPGRYNISYGTSFSITEVAYLLKAMTNSNSLVSHKPTIKGEVLISELFSDSPAGWKSTTPFGLGLRETIEFFRQ